MKRLRQLIRNFFGFSRMETNAFLLFIPLISIILFSEPVYRMTQSDDQDYFANISKTDSLFALFPVGELELPARKVKDTTLLHAFDPNTLPENELVALGLPKGLAGRIVRYREKGGKFRRKEDML